SQSAMTAGASSPRGGPSGPGIGRHRFDRALAGFLTAPCSLVFSENATARRLAVARQPPPVAGPVVDRGQSRRRRRVPESPCPPGVHGPGRCDRAVGPAGFASARPDAGTARLAAARARAAADRARSGTVLGNRRQPAL